jgi:DNA ligase D-like protein (predicted polymerase)/DNA ligase D-like protein (predicted ligase)
MPTKQQVDVEGRQLALTNLDKVLYPGNGFTKAHVIDYYLRVSKWLLPHFSGRPVTLLRFPDGVDGKMFYEKDAPDHLPEWVRTTEVPRTGKGSHWRSTAQTKTTPIRYICIDDVPTLVLCANLASLELHPFLHRAGQLDCPASIVFDLDPGEGLDLVACAEVALLLRGLLRSSGLECFAKVSGSKGLQLYAPLNTPVTYEQTRTFAHEAAKMLAVQHPSLVLPEMAKELRKQKVFIDWSQNTDYKTTIGVYSLRAKNEVPYVSAPVSWAELEGLRDASTLRFEPEALLKRVSTLGDLMAPVLTMQQTLPGTPVPVRAKSVAFVEPMLLETTSQLPEGPDWLYELKLDGYRALAMKNGGKVSLRSRNDNDFGTRFAGIARALAKLPDETVIDGEVVALDAEGRPAFNLLQNHGSSKAPIVFYVFDLLMLRGRDVMREPLTARRALLEKEVLLDLAEPIRYSPVLEARLPDLIQSVKASGLEGLVAKKRSSLYEPGMRSGAWRKMRVNLGQELVIGGYTPSGKNFDALIIGYFENGALLYVARTRNGFTPALRQTLFAKLQKLEIAACPFANLPEESAGRWGQGLTAVKMKDCRWLEPVTVGRFEFVEWTPDNHLRHSKFAGLVEDRAASAVVRE